MNKKDMAIVAVLFALLMGWTFYQAKYMKPPPDSGGDGATNLLHSTTGTVGGATALAPDVNVAPEPAPAPEPAVVPEPEPVKLPETPEQRFSLTSGVAEVTVSSWGGVIVAAELSEYRQTLDSDSGPLFLDFSDRPALALGGIDELGTDVAYDLKPASDGAGVQFEKRTSSGLLVTRQFSYDDSYRIQIVDTFANTGDSPLTLDEHTVGLGPMERVPSKYTSSRYAYLGLDTLMDGEKTGVVPWGKKALPAKFGVSKGGLLSCLKRAPVTTMPPTVTMDAESPVAWAAAKNKFFVQILAPEHSADDCRLHAGRDLTHSNGFLLGSVSADLVFADRELKPGETFERKMSYYIGPKKFSELHKLGGHQDKVMLRSWRYWGWWRAACIGLLWLLNIFKFVTRNYGVAIIMLTVLVKIVMWPLTHKSTANMKKMQEVQPLLQKVREKHKDNPQKMQQATMEIYRQNKVNPMAGCLPMLLQMPVFIALFTVLRSAVELRFAPFLWIKDLSEPEGLFQGVVSQIPIIGPMAGSLNLLPLAMTATMVWQQKLTPSSGDAQQKQMMVFMPIFMLFLFYKMPSALVLYWTISQVLSIAQLILQKRKDAPAA